MRWVGLVTANELTDVRLRRSDLRWFCRLRASSVPAYADIDGIGRTVGVRYKGVWCYFEHEDGQTVRRKSTTVMWARAFNFLPRQQAQFLAAARYLAYRPRPARIGRLDGSARRVLTFFGPLTVVADSTSLALELKDEQGVLLCAHATGEIYELNERLPALISKLHDRWVRALKGGCLDN